MGTEPDGQVLDQLADGGVGRVDQLLVAVHPDLDHLGRTQDQAAIKLRPPFRSVWSVALSGLLEYSAVVSDGVAYIGNANATIYAISMLDGKIMWRHDTPHAGLASSPAVWGDKLVYHDMRGTVWMLDRATGRVRWHYGVGSPIESSPIMRGGVDYFGTWDGRIFALDLKHGRIRWVRSVGSKITGSVVLDGNVLYLGDYSGRLWSLYAGNGRMRWTGSVNGRIYGTTAVAAGFSRVTRAVNPVTNKVYVPNCSSGTVTMSGG